MNLGGEGKLFEEGTKEATNTMPPKLRSSAPSNVKERRGRVSRDPENRESVGAAPPHLHFLPTTHCDAVSVSGP